MAYKPFESTIVDTWYTQYHPDKPIISSSHQTMDTPQFRRFQLVLSTFPSSESIALLRSLDVCYVVVDATYYDVNALRMQLAELGLREEAVLESHHVFLFECHDGTSSNQGG